MTPTVLDSLIDAISKTAEWNRSVSQPPVAILWTDEHRQWEAIVPNLRTRLPRFVTLGAYAPEAMTGPAIWIRCVLAGHFEGAGWPREAIPVVYLPGVSRTRLRAIETCDPAIAPIAELQYRGVFFTHSNARDWTVHGFLKSVEGLGLDVADDKATSEAMLRALPVLAETEVEQLRKGRLEADDFNLLLRPDPARDLLRWVQDPVGIRNSWSGAEWSAFRELCRADYAFDPERDGQLLAGERLGRREGAWAAVWERYVEGAASYPAVLGLLERVHPQELALGADRSSWPRYNAEDEARLRAGLTAIKELSPYEARMRVLALEGEHGKRRDWVWARLGLAPLASALESLNLLATLTGQSLVGADADAMAALYTARGFEVDDAAMSALGAVSRAEDFAAVQAALAATYVPWLTLSAEQLQGLVRRDGYPSVGRVGEAAGEDGILLFADGLRMDVGRRLERRLASLGYDVAVRHRWAAVPSVTATCKAAVSPIAEGLGGTETGSDFVPGAKKGSSGETKALTTDRFRGLLREAGYEVLGRDESGKGGGQAWVEYGDLDHLGHDEGCRMARRIEEQVAAMAERVEALLNAGWRSVKVVTDHGWLLVPGGMPKVELDGALAETRWGRCAVLKASTTGGERLVLDWHWSSGVRIAVPPGISAYKMGIEYAHGGVSLQECVTPVLVVTAKTTPSAVSIDAVKWVNLICRLTVSGAGPGHVLDLRKRAADKASSVLGAPKDLELGGGKGKASVVVADDELIGEAVSVVVINASGAVVARRATTVGGE